MYEMVSSSPFLIVLKDTSATESFNPTTKRFGSQECFSLLLIENQP